MCLKNDGNIALKVHFFDFRKCFGVDLKSVVVKRLREFFLHWKCVGISSEYSCGKEVMAHLTVINFSCLGGEVRKDRVFFVLTFFFSANKKIKKIRTKTPEERHVAIPIIMYYAADIKKMIFGKTFKSTENE